MDPLIALNALGDFALTASTVAINAFNLAVGILSFL